MGMITDLSGMCAELSSNCNTREIMYFKVTDCESGELYEGKIYFHMFSALFDKEYFSKTKIV